ncbi:MAG: sigma-70 family RNA polymerase sigma factor [Bacteroidales bacterium]|nr:sigma-70 family RNA polymerase sigma factor [Bacteroidales bacterium]
MVDLITLSPMAKQQRILDAVQNYGKRLFSFIRSRVKSDEDAEDILQDVWFQLSSLVDIEPIGQLSSWLYRVSRNRIVDKQRKLKPQSLDDLAYENEDGEMMYPDALLAGDSNPEMELERAYLREELFEALNELPPKQRDVFVWNELEDMTLQEIADKTGESIKTIISRKRYAVANLREWFENLYNEY